MKSLEKTWRWLSTRPGQVAVAIILAGLLLAGGMGLWQARQNAQLAEIAFLKQSDHLVDLLHARMQGYTHGLRGLRGIFVVKPDASLADFTAYMATRDLPAEFPGALGMGFARFTPDGKHGVDYFSPAAMAQTVASLDFNAAGPWRTAARHATDSGTAILSAPLELSGAPPDRIGLAYLLPIYRPGQPTATPEQRAAALLGWSFMTLDIAAVFAGLVDDPIDFALYDMSDAAGRLAFTTGNHAPAGASLAVAEARHGPRELSRHYDLLIGTRAWRLVVSPLPDFWRRINPPSPLFFVLGGLAISLLSALAAYLSMTLRQRAEVLAGEMTEKLRFSEAREHDFSLSMSDWFWETDAEHRFIFISDNFEKTYHVVAREIHGKTRRDLLMRNGLVPAAQIAAHQAQLDAHMAFRDFEYPIYGADGALRWIAVSGVPYLDAQGRFAGHRGTGTNITARKATETELIETRDEAERANQAKSDFLSSMSHELRTPMNAVIGFAQMLEYDAALNADQQDNVREILKAGRHLLTLINEVLDLAKIESGRIDLSLEPVDVGGLVEECRQLILPLATEKNIALDMQAPARATVRADRVRLKQALLNLLSNAVKYTHAGGDVRLETHAAHGRDEKRLRIEVVDTGPGIPAGRLAELFEPFNRVGLENSEIEGTGIGLSITRRIVEMMEGTVGVDSTEGVGSRFWIDLPAAAAPGMAAPDSKKVGAGATASAAGKRHAVLYIEDNPANLKLVAQILRRRPAIDLLTAPLPELGIELARTHRPALILLDINLPGMDGYQVLDILRTQTADKTDAAAENTPIVAVTANAMPRDIERGRAASFTDYIAKPLDVVEFLAMIDRYLQPGKEPDR